MADNKRRIYKCTDPVLHYEAGLIINACEADADVTARLPAGVIPAAKQALKDAISATTGQGNNAAELTGLTTGQDDAIADIENRITLARDTAKLAFRGQDTKLRAQFGVGERADSLASIEALAERVHAGCIDPDNAPGLAARGWLAADSAALKDAILALGGADIRQEQRKAVNKGGTMEYIATNNALYDAITTMQNAARIQYRGDTPADAGARQAFRIGIFPPPRGKGLPNMPRKFVARPGEAGSLTLNLDWNISKRAKEYVGNITSKTTGAPIATFTTEDNKHTLVLSGITPGTEVQLVLIARNELGKSKPTDPITATVP